MIFFDIFSCKNPWLSYVYVYFSLMKFPIVGKLMVRQSTRHTSLHSLLFKCHIFLLCICVSCNSKILFVLIVNSWKLLHPLCNWMYIIKCKSKKCKGWWNWKPYKQRNWSLCLVYNIQYQNIFFIPLVGNILEIEEGLWMLIS